MSGSAPLIVIIELQAAAEQAEGCRLEPCQALSYAHIWRAICCWFSSPSPPPYRHHHPWGTIALAKHLESKY